MTARLYDEAGAPVTTVETQVRQAVAQELTPVGGEQLWEAGSFSWRAPTVSWDAQGGYLASWIMYDGSYPADVRRFDAAGRPAGARVTVALSVNSLDVAPTQDGGFVAAFVGWPESLGGPAQVYFAKYDSNSVLERRQAVTVTATAADSDEPVALATDGVSQAVVVTARAGGLYGQRYDLAGTALGGELFIGSRTALSVFTQTDGLIDVQMTPTGGFTVVWSDGDGAGKGVYSRRYDAQGNALSAAVRANTETVGEQEQVHLAVDADTGDYAIAWRSDTVGADGVFVQRYLADGSAQGGEVRLAAGGYSPKIGLHEGTLILSYADALDEGQVWLAVYDAGLVARQPDGTATPVSTTLVSDVGRLPGMQLSADGEVQLAWVDGLHNFRSFRSQRFAVAAPWSWADNWSGQVNLNLGSTPLPAGTYRVEVELVDAEGGSAPWDGDPDWTRTSELWIRVDDAGAVSHFVADPQAFDAPISVTAGDQHTQRTYDALGRVQFQVDPQGYVTEYRYDRHGQVTETRAYDAPIERAIDEVTVNNHGWVLHNFGRLEQSAGYSVQYDDPAFTHLVPGTIEAVIKGSAGAEVRTVTTGVGHDVEFQLWQSVSAKQEVFTGHGGTALAVDGARQRLVAALPTTGSGPAVLKRYAANGSLIVEMPRSIGTAVTEIELTALMDNRYVAAWWGTPAGGSTGLYVERFTEAGVSQGGPVLIPGATQRYALDGNGEDRYSLVYEQAGNLYAQQYDVDGVAQFVNPLLIGAVLAGATESLHVDTDRDGNLLVTWTAPDANGQGVYARRYDAASAQFGALHTVNTLNVNGDQRNASGALDAANGGFVVVWEDHSDVDNRGIHLQRYDAAEAVTTPDVLLASLSTNAAVQDTAGPEVVLADNGDATVIWSSDRAVVLQRFNVDGVAQADALGLGDPSGVNQIAAVRDHTGKLHVAWDGDVAAGAPVYLRELAFSGNGIYTWTPVENWIGQVHLGDQSLPPGQYSIDLTVINRDDPTDTYTRSIDVIVDGDGQMQLLQPALSSVEIAAELAGVTSRRIMRDYDLLGRVTQETDAENGVTATDYDAFGNITQLTDPNGNAGYFYYDAENRERLAIDPEGYATETVYDAFGNAAETVRYANRVSGVYDGNSDLTTLLGTQLTAPAANDQHTYNTYDNRNQLAQLTDAESAFERYGYDAFGNRVSVLDKNGHTTLYGFDANNRKDSETLPINGYVNGVAGAAPVINEFVYDAFDNLKTQTEAAGLDEQRITGYTYDSLNRQTTVTQNTVDVWDDALGIVAQAPTTTNSYDVFGNLVQETDARGNITTHYYDLNGRRIATVDAEGYLRTKTYDAVGNVLEERTYDDPLPQPDPTAPAAPLGAAPEGTGTYRSMQYTYNGNNLRTGTLRAGTDGAAIQFYNLDQADPYYKGTISIATLYDANGSVIKQMDGRGNAQYAYYDQAGNQILSVDALGYAVRTTYDHAGNTERVHRYATAITSPLDETSVIGSQADIDALITSGVMVVHTDDRITAFDYDRMNRTLEERVEGVAYVSVGATGVVGNHEGGSVKSYQYDGAGNLRQADENGEITNYHYDALNRQELEENPQFSDYAGNTVRNTTRFVYDGLGQTIDTIREGDLGTTTDDQLTQTTYNALGWVTSRTDAEGNTTTYHYDANGNAVRQVVTRLNIDARTETLTTAFGYDALNRQIHETHEASTISGLTGAALTNALALLDAANVTRDVQYNAHGEVVTKGINGGQQEYFEYNEVGQVIKTNAENGTTRVYVYDENGNATLEIHSTSLDLRDLTIDDILAQEGAALSDVRAFRSEYDARNQLIGRFEPPIEFQPQTGSVEQIWVDVPQGQFPAGKVHFSPGGNATFDVYSKPITVTGLGIKRRGTTVARQIERIVVRWPSMAGYGDSQYRIKLKAGRQQENAPHPIYYFRERYANASETSEVYDTPNSHVTWDLGPRLTVTSGDVSTLLQDDRGTDLQGLGENDAYWFDVSIYKKDVPGELVATFEPGPGGQWAWSKGLWYGSDHFNHKRYISTPIASVLSFGDQLPNSDRLKFRFAAKGSNNWSGWYSATKLPNGNFVRTPSVLPGSGEYDIEYKAIDDKPNDPSEVVSHAIATFNTKTGTLLGMKALDRPPVSVPELQYQIFEDPRTSVNVIHRSQQYNAFGEIIAETDGRGNALALSNDQPETERRKELGYFTDVNNTVSDANALTEVQKQELRDIHTSYIDYNKLGQVVEKTDAETSATAENGIQSRIRPLTSYGYDRNGNVLTTTDANGNVTRQRLEGGQVVESYNPYGDGKQFLYDAFGNLHQQHNVERVYDQDDNLIEEKQFNLSVNQYDSNNQLKQVNRYLDPVSALHTYDSYDYDAVGNRIRHTNGNDDVETYRYDAVGNIIEHASFQGRKTNYSYQYDATIGGGVGGYRKNHLSPVWRGGGAGSQDPDRRSQLLWPHDLP